MGGGEGGPHSKLPGSCCCCGCSHTAVVAASAGGAAHCCWGPCWHCTYDPPWMCMLTIHSICLPLCSSAPTPTFAFVIALICACSCTQLCSCWSPLLGHSHLAFVHAYLCSSILIWAHFTFVCACSRLFVPTWLCLVSWSPLPGHAHLAFICTCLGSFWLCSYLFLLIHLCPPGCACLSWSPVTGHAHLPLFMLAHAHSGLFGLWWVSLLDPQPLVCVCIKYVVSTNIINKLTFKPWVINLDKYWLVFDTWNYPLHCFSNWMGVGEERTGWR